MVITPKNRKEFAAKEKLEIVQSERVASAGGRKGGLGGIPPALQILGEISSNFFESTPPFLIIFFKDTRIYKDNDLKKSTILRHCILKFSLLSYQ